MEQYAFNIFSDMTSRWGVSTAVTFLFVLVTVRGVPWAYKQFTGKLKEEHTARDNTRSTVSRIDKRLSEINGSFKDHCNNRAIHPLVSEIVTRQEYDARHIAIQAAVEDLKGDFRHTADRIFDRLDKL
ncbi:MAG: hypothetical protein PHQ43_04525 [Dehalococcoidales bacterium]|nr:hypothetical protein [Dehalococcoidales bacterium]